MACIVYKATMRSLSWFRLPAVGHAPAFFSDRLGFVERSARQADVVEVRLGRRRTYLLGDPGDIRHVLVTEHHRFTKNPRLMRPDDPALFRGALVGTAKAEHADRRRVVQPAYHQRHADRFATVVERCVAEVAERWADRGEIDLVAETVALAQGARIRALLGDDTPEALRLLPPAMEARQRYIARSFVSPVPFAGRLPSRARHAHRAAAGVLESVLSPAVVARRAKPREDVLTLLVEAHADEPTDVAAAHALDEARTFLASYEVSSTALAWALHVLAEHPDAQALVAGSAEAGTLGDAQRVVSETLRLYPPSWLFSRVALEGVQLPTGHRLPASSRVFLSPWATHRDPRWFPDPERFDPDRFLPGAAKARARYAYFPFGGGPHVCIGEGLARTEAALVIGALCRRFELALVPGTAATPTPRVTLELGGSPRIRVVPRRPA